jgi:hypothetical protein
MVVLHGRESAASCGGVITLCEPMEDQVPGRRDMEEATKGQGGNAPFNSGEVGPGPSKGEWASN